MTSIFSFRTLIKNEQLPCFIVNDALDPEGCRNIIKQLKDQVEPGTHMDSNTGELIKSDTRKSGVKFFRDDTLNARLRELVDIANHEAGWRYDIVDQEMAQFTSYDGAEQQTYDWHTDGQCDHWCARESSLFHNIKLEEMNLKYTPDPRLLGTVRKISVSAILNDDYEGGELLFSTIEKDSTVKITNIKARKGDLVIFPSFIEHKVAPVTKGTRYSIVAWYGGPPFK